jgi:rhamnose utilization protein RhaD (predicted bifunctional aldolase and dehydrogenase)
MFDEALKSFEYISKAAGLPIEYTQGGGGNTSVKLNDELMAVKASGYKLKQITPAEGYVVVNYKKIKEFYDNVDLSSDRDYEKKSSEFVKSCIVRMEGLKELRPSVEAGFHSVLQEYVIHTHPVYANILCCSKNGKELVQKIFGTERFATAWIPYINPGFCLTLKIKEAIQKSIDETGRFPQVIFMENHGLIVTADDSKECFELHLRVNNMIRDYFEIQENYPELQLEKLDENTYASRTGYLISYFKNNPVKLDFFDKIILYPDQLVYLNGSLSVDSMNGKMNIDTKTGEIIYKSTESEAQTMEEALLAYVYIIESIKRLGLPIKTMTDKDVDFIANWESERYRKSLVKNLGK